MATAAENYLKILTAIDGLQRDYRESLGAVNVTVAGLLSGVEHLSEALGELAKKVDRVELQKASSTDLQAAELRIDRTVSDFRAQTKVDLARLDTDKVGHSQFSIDSYDSVCDRLNDIDKRTGKLDTIDSTVKRLEDSVEKLANRVEVLNQFKWKIIGGYAALAGAGTLLGWFLHAFSTH